MRNWLLLIFSIIILGCKKETSIENLTVPTSPNNNQQLITAEYLDGQKLKEFFYDNAGKLIGARNYAHPKSGEIEWIMERIYNNKGLPIRDNYRRPGRSYIYEYRIYTYNNNICIADSTFEGSSNSYYPYKIWNMQNIEDDIKGRIKKMYAEEFGVKYYQEFIYNNNSNVIRELNSSSNNIWPPFTNQYEFSTDKAFHHPLANMYTNISLDNIYIYNRWNHKTDKNFCTKFSNSSITIYFTILEKNDKGNPTKIKWDFSRPDGSTQTDIYTYTYK